MIRSYPALIDLGLLVGALLATVEAPRRGLKATHVLDTVLAAAVGGLILARASYVGVHWDYYTNHPRQALRLRDGGLAWHGALIGGTAGAAALCALRGKRLLVALDVLAGGAASVAVFAWLGCLMAGCAYGIPTYPGNGLVWKLSLDLPDLFRIREPRVAVQLLGAAWSALVLAATLAAQRRVQNAGSVFALWLTLHSLGSFALGFLRGDGMPLLSGWRVDQVANLALGIAGIGAMFFSSAASGWGSRASGRKPKTEVPR